MLKSWRLGRLLGFPIEINASFLLLLAVVFLAFGGLTGVMVVGLAFASVLLHELGHAVVARQRGIGIAGIELGFLGGAAKMVDVPRTWRDEAWIAAAGPAVSLMLAGAGLGLGGLTGVSLLGLIGWINLVIAGFNLLPALPMDGGRILRALLARRFDYVRATDLSITVARAVALGFVVIGLLGAYQLLILAPFLWFMGTREKLMARMIAPEMRGYGRDTDAGVEVLDRAPWDEEPASASWHEAWHGRERATRWGSPFDPRTGGGATLPRFTLRFQGGRLVVVPID